MPAPHKTDRNKKIDPYAFRKYNFWLLNHFVVQTNYSNERPTCTLPLDSELPAVLSDRLGLATHDSSPRWPLDLTRRRSRD